MRFRRLSKWMFRDTHRRRAAVLRRQARERESLPLFADQIEEEQADVDTVMADRSRQWEIRIVTERQRRATKWQQARKQLSRYPHSERVRLIDFWNRHRWFPGDPAYLLDMLHMYDHGRLDLNAPGVLEPRSK